MEKISELLCVYFCFPQLRGREEQSELLQLSPAAVTMVTKFDKISDYQTCQFVKHQTSDPDDGDRDGS
jgi:hypothetical protein